MRETKKKGKWLMKKCCHLSVRRCRSYGPTAVLQTPASRTCSSSWRTTLASRTRSGQCNNRTNGAVQQPCWWGCTTTLLVGLYNNTTGGAVQQPCWWGWNNPAGGAGIALAVAVVVVVVVLLMMAWHWYCSGSGGVDISGWRWWR